MAAPIIVIPPPPFPRAGAWDPPALGSCVGFYSQTVDWAAEVHTFTENKEPAKQGGEARRRGESVNNGGLEKKHAPTRSQ